MIQRRADEGCLGRVLGAYGPVSLLAVLVGLGIASSLGGRVNTLLLLSAVCGRRAPWRSTTSLIRGAPRSTPGQAERSGLQ
jgi:hypothetical protein